jgi:hypothetical protein
MLPPRGLSLLPPLPPTSVRGVFGATPLPNISSVSTWLDSSIAAAASTAPWYWWMSSGAA